ncbi:MAG: SDR family oxidoreductase [Solirubrobacteraceae bacterium]
MSDKRGAVFITGATGLIGGQVMRRLLAVGRPVVALVRGAVPWEHPDLRLVSGDLTTGPFPDLPDDVDTIIHCAASVGFDLPLQQQRQINVEGTRRVLEAAAGLQLGRFMHVSTAFVAGDHDGVFGPEDLDRGQGFRNTYEQSKFEAEHLVRESGLPWQIVRPSIVVGDQHTGWTTAFNVVYGPLRAYARGLMQVAPGNVEAPVDLVPIDVVSRGMVALLDEPVGGTHLLVSGSRAPSVGEFVEQAASVFGLEPAVVLDHAALTALVARLPPDDAAAARRAMGQAATLLPYFDVSCSFSDPATEAVLSAHGIDVPSLGDYLPALIAYAESVRWGKRMPAASLEHVSGDPVPR